VWSVARGGSAAEERADALLASCYRRCLELARDYEVRSIAFPAISTGVYRFPPERAARIAVNVVRQSLEGSGVQRVIFCAYNMEAEAIYRELLLRG
ncbi:MAG TPA: macro domain-containing protein, partial [Terriglobus sp.]